MLLSCGEALYDLFLSAKTGAMVQIDAQAGGSPFNVAIGLSRLGCSSALFTGISSDPLGRRLEQTLKNEGVETFFLTRKKNPTSLALINLNDDGVPDYNFYGYETADCSVSESDLPNVPESVTAIHFGSYSLVVEPTGSSMLRLAHQYHNKLLISLDPNLRLNIEPNLDKWRRRVEHFAQLADLIKVSEEDLNLLFPDDQIDSVIDRWRAQSVQLIVVTKGEHNTQVSLRNESFEVLAHNIDVIDTVGAGDSFQAGLLCGLDELGKATKAGLSELSLEECRQIIELATQAAAITCTRQGANPPYRSDLTNHFNSPTQCE